jgi:hypothetical protein
MKTIKFFSFAMLLSLAWASCKDASTASTETATAEVLADSVFTATKADVSNNLAALQQAVTAKVAELEASLATATEATKAGITTELESYKKFQADLQATSTKVAEATAENWAAVSAEVETVHSAVKTAMAGSAAAPSSVSKEAAQLTK